MNPPKKSNPAASARARLLNLARERQEDFQLLLTRYGLERLLYRLSQSPYRDRFILKGAMLFVLWGEEPHRPTRDVDFLGSGDGSEESLREVFKALCSVNVEPDGVSFDPESVRVQAIRDDTEYGGMRVTLVGDLAGARIPIQADIGFGDAVTPDPVEIVYPTLLTDPAPTLRACPRETVIAEKFQALVFMSMAFDYDGALLSRAIGHTFARRRTELPSGTPIALRPDFALDRQKNIQWNAFLSKLGASANGLALSEVCERLSIFLAQPAESARNGVEFRATWRNGGPWKENG